MNVGADAPACKDDRVSSRDWRALVLCRVLAVAAVTTAVTIHNAHNPSSILLYSVVLVVVVYSLRKDGHVVRELVDVIDVGVGGLGAQVVMLDFERDEISCS